MIQILTKENLFLPLFTNCLMISLILKTKWQNHWEDHMQEHILIPTMSHGCYGFDVYVILLRMIVRPKKKKFNSDADIEKNLFMFVKNAMFQMLEKSGINLDSILRSDADEFKIEEFLKKLKLEEYENLFQKHKITSKEILLNLNEKDIETLIPEAIGDRTNLRMAISKLKNVENQEYIFNLKN